jgi:hypothetical protein
MFEHPLEKEKLSFLEKNTFSRLPLSQNYIKKAWDEIKLHKCITDQNFCIISESYLTKMRIVYSKWSTHIF